MNKKGFTLIELLAVIVILAIIALIATPAVLNIIEDSKKSAAEASARNIVSAAKTYYMQQTMKGTTPDTIDLSSDTLKYSGDQATKGYIEFNGGGKASGKMYISGYCVEVKEDGKVESEKMEEDECTIEVTPSEPTTYTKYNDGYELLFDPTTGGKCETSIGSSTGTNDGCMKWYAFLDSEDSSTVKLLLDHNISENVAWGNEGETTPTVVNAKLQDDIKNWNDAVKSTARLISASEVNRIAPRTDGTAWNVNDYTKGYVLHTGTVSDYKGTAGTNIYAWLFDNTITCKEYGCNTEDSGTYGYWTSSYAGSGYTWLVYYGGSLGIHDVYRSDLDGIRPVITVSKSIFK